MPEERFTRFVKSWMFDADQTVIDQFVNPDGLNEFIVRFKGQYIGTVKAGSDGKRYAFNLQGILSNTAYEDVGTAITHVLDDRKRA